MRTSRRWPPIRVTAETSGTCLMVSSSCAAIRRRFEIVVAAAGERQRENGHIVDGARLHQRLRSARRDQIEIGEQLLVQADDALLFVLAHIETHDRQRHAGAGSGVDVLDARNLPEQFLHGPGDALLHLVRRSSGHLNEDVDHRHDDLRLLFARQFPHGKRSDEQRRADQKRRQFGGDPRAERDVPRGPGGGAHSLPDLYPGAILQARGHGQHNLFARVQAG